MGEYFQSIADVAAAEDEAGGLAERLTPWLIESGVLAAERADCVLGCDLGHRPGPGWASVVTEPSQAHVLELRTNGVEFLAGRTVFHTGQYGVSDADCPRCGARAILSDSSSPDWAGFSDAIGAWYEGGSREVACPRCQRMADFNDWLWADDWGTWALCYFGLTFWNWPLLTDSFVADVAARLGHRVVHVHGKL